MEAKRCCLCFPPCGVLSRFAVGFARYKMVLDVCDIVSFSRQHDNQ